MPGPPPSLTKGIPDPGAIARQKDVYIKMLDEQLNQGIVVLDQQVKYQRDYLDVQCKQQKQQFIMQLEQQVKAQDMALTQQYNEQLMALRMQADAQKSALQQQAMQLTMEYEQRKAEENMYRQQYELQKQHSEMASKFVAPEHARMPQQPSLQPMTHTSYTGPPVATQQQSGYNSPMPGGHTHMGTMTALMPTPTMPAGTLPPTMYNSTPQTIVRPP